MGLESNGKVPGATARRRDDGWWDVLARPTGSTPSTCASRCSGFPLRFIVASSAGTVFITNGRRAGR